MANNKDNRVLCLGTIGLIVAPWKFDVLKTSIFALEASLLGANISVKNIKFPLDNYQPIVPRQKHSIIKIVPVRENFSLNKRVCRKLTIEIVLRGFCLFSFSDFIFGFHGFRLKIWKIIQLKSD